jgi:hypothetical protein
MALNIFLVLNGLAVVFLLYVLANFWKEGRREKNNALKYTAEFGQRDWNDMVVRMQPISHSSKIGFSMIPFQTRERKPAGKSADGLRAGEAVEIPLRKISTR